VPLRLGAALTTLGLLASAGVVTLTTGAASAATPPAYALARSATRPAVVEKVVIGHSVRHRPIVAYHLGEQGPGIPTMMIVSTMHGNERQIQQIPEALRDGRRIHGVDLWVVPVMNPDGLARDTRQNARGVDLNRNFPTHWVHTTGHYGSGPRAASEPETRAMMRFLLKVRPDRLVSFHQPLHGVDLDSRRPGFSHQVARALHLPVSHVKCGGICGGTMTQWFEAHLPGTAITVEYGAHPSSHTLRVQAPKALLRLFGGHR
jgi:predicted deacylase